MASLYFAVQARIADEIQANINIAQWLRQAYEQELGTQFGVGKNGEPPKCGLNPKTTQGWRDVVKAVEALGDLKIRLDKHAKTMAENMTPEEELAAVSAYIRSLTPEIAEQFLAAEVKWRASRK